MERRFYDDVLRIDHAHRAGIRIEKTLEATLAKALARLCRFVDPRARSPRVTW